MPSGPRVTVNFDLGKMARASQKHMTELANDAADVTAQAWHDQFARGKSPSGKPWTKIKAKTAVLKGNNRVLVDTRRLDDGAFVSKRATIGNKTAIFRPSKDRQVVADAHNAGNKNLPQRKLIPDTGFYPSSQAKIDSLIANTARKIGKAVKISRITIGG